MRRSDMIGGDTISMHVAEPDDCGLDARALQRFRDCISADIQRGVCDGAVVVLARAGKIGLHECFGHTDLSRDRRAARDDVFLLMSLAKIMTATAVMQQIDRGRLALTTRIAEVIPEFAQKGKERITVFHLLTHTGGVWSGFTPPPPMPHSQAGNLSAIVDAVCRSTLQSIPGERVTYSPMAGYSILGEVVRRVDGGTRRFRDILAQDVFTALGMRDTAFGLRADLADRRVPLAIRETTEGVADHKALVALNEILDADAERPSGGAFSTAADIYRFAEMWRLRGRLGDTRIVSAALAELAVRNHTGSRPNTFWDYAREMRGIPQYPANFGFGFYVRGEGVHFTSLGHSASAQAFGAVGGGATGFLVDPARELVFVFLSAGLLEGLNHFDRLRRLSDLALACVAD